MRRLHKAVTFLLIILCVAGAAFAFLFLRKEQELALHRQQEISEVSKALEPINEERKKWEQKDAQWQETLSEKQKGRTCVLLGFDHMSRELYDTMFDLMEQYGFRGTFAMRNGRMPSWEMEKGDEFSSGEMMQEILDAGWDCAVSVGDEPDDDESGEEAQQRDFSDEFGDTVLESETSEESSEADSEADVQENESETESPGFLADLDGALTRLSENGYSQPTVLFCTKEQYAEATDAGLAERGFTMVSVADAPGSSLPMINQEQNQQADAKLWLIDAGVYTQSNEQLEKQLDLAVAKQQSVAIQVNEIAKIVKDTDQELSLSLFTSLLNYLRELESDRKINVLTYSEYYQYEQLRKQSYEQAVAEYAAFREEMLAALEELDMQEAEIANNLQETELLQDTSAGLTEEPESGLE